MIFKDETKAELVYKLEGDKAYIKLIKNPKSNAWEIKMFQGNTKADVDALRAVIDYAQNGMQKEYGQTLTED